MNVSDVQHLFLRRLNLRIEPHMAGYVLKHLQQTASASARLPVMGTHARTGVPLRQMIDLEPLNGAASASQTA